MYEDNGPYHYHTGENSKGERLTFSGRMVDLSRGIMRIGVAKCCKHDKFNRSHGRKIADGRSSMDHMEDRFRDRVREGWIQEIYVKDYGTYSGEEGSFVVIPGRAFKNFCAYYAFEHGYHPDRSMKVISINVMTRSEDIAAEKNKVKEDQMDDLPF